jgi:hypothetical protein
VGEGAGTPAWFGWKVAPRSLMPQTLLKMVSVNVTGYVVDVPRVTV